MEHDCSLRHDYRAEIARIAGGGKRVWPIVGDDGEMGGPLALDSHNVQVVEMAFDLRGKQINY